MPAKAAPKKNLSALKKVRQDEKRRERNQSVKTALRTHAKNVEAAVASKSKEEADTQLKKTISMLDKAATKGVIHRNTAARKISRLTKKVNSAFTGEAKS
ncbi:MAG: 30S ribosomal protein S20 [Thermodesulfovibrionales bacterium]